MPTYDIQGSFYEACDCEVICACWAGVAPDMGSCTGVFVWDLQSGLVDAVDVSATRLMVLNYGPSCDRTDKMLVLVDAASAAQEAALQTALHNGPWSQVFMNMPATSDVVAATITVTGTSFKAVPKANQRDLAVGVNQVFSPTAVTLHSGTPGDLIGRIVGQALPASITVGQVLAPVGGGDGLNLLADVINNGQLDYTFDLDIDGVSAVSGAFRYVM